MPLEGASDASVFLCHSSADKHEVERIARSLRQAGIEPWLDTWNLLPGEEFATEIESAMRACSAIAVFIGPTGRSPWQNAEVNRAINTSIETGKPLIPVLLPDTQEDLVGDFLKDRVAVAFSTIDDPEALKRLIDGIRGERVRPAVASTSDSGHAFDDGCPYAGLLRYDVRHAAYFFGRERATDRAVEKIEASLTRADGARFLAILGASGTGKSSFARAGVVHTLLSRHPAWRYIAFEPSTDPIGRMTAELAGLAAAGTTALYSSSMGVGDWALASLPAEARLIILVDQFEEVFTRCPDKTCEQFVSLLVSAAGHPSGKCIVLLTLRMDFYDKCSRFETLFSLMSDLQIALGPLDTPGLQAAIERPVRKQMWDVEPALVATLVAECGREPPLPLLGTVLKRLWKMCRASRKLTLATYQSLTLRGAVNELANEIPQRERDLALQLFSKLAAPGAKGMFVRRRTAIVDLLPDDPAEIKRVEALVGRLAGPDFRLLTIQVEDGQATIEPAHETIFEAWTDLSHRLDNDRALLAWRQRLEGDLLAWHKSLRAAYCIDGQRLNEALAFVKQRSSDLTRLEREYVAACKRRRNRRRAGIAGIAGLTLFASAAVVYIGLSRAALANLKAEARHQIHDLRNPIGLVLAYEAARREGGEENEILLQEALQKFTEPLLVWESENQNDSGFNDLAMSGDGLSVAAAARDGSVLVWQASTKPRSGAPRWGPDLQPPVVFSLAAPAAKVSLTDDGKFVAAGSGGADGQVSVWELATRSPAFPFGTVGAPVTALAIEDAGRAIAMATDQGILWQRKASNDRKAPSGSPQPGRITPPARALSLSLAPRASLLAVASEDGLVRIYNLESGQLSGSPIQHQGVANYVAFSRDGELLGSGGRMADVKVSKVSGELTFGPTGVTAISTAFSRNGKVVAALNSDNSIVVWDAGSGKELHRIPPAGGPTKIAISGDASRVAALLSPSGGRSGASAPARARIYELDSAELLRSARSLIGLHDEINCGLYPPARVDCEKLVPRPGGP